nr:hypothetical protein [Tanacetum cinerariifolium]
MSSSSSSSHATVTYIYVSSDTDLPSWGIPLLEAYEYGQEAPLSLVHALEDPECLLPSDDDIAPVEDQPLPALPIVLSPGYIADSVPIEDNFEEDLEIDPVDYVDVADDEEESYNDEEEHLAPSNSALFVPDYIPSSKETEPFETDESAATPPPPTSPHYIILFSKTKLRREQIFVRPHTPPSSSAEARIVEYASAPRPPSPSPSLLSPLSSPLSLIPSPPLHLPSPTRMDIILEADMPLRKRVRFTDPSYRFDIRESSAAATARQTGPALTCSVDYGFIDTLDASIRATNERVMTALEGVNKRMTDLAATHRYASEEFYTRYQDAQDDRSLLQDRISTLEREGERR